MAELQNFRLMVSRDCGVTYHEEQRALNVSMLMEECKRLDEALLRWYIEHPDGHQMFDLPCAIHYAQIKVVREHDHSIVTSDQHYPPDVLARAIDLPRFLEMILDEDGVVSSQKMQDSDTKVSITSTVLKEVLKRGEEG